MSIEAKLNEEIERELDGIYNLDVGSQEHTAAVRNLKEVTELAIEMRKLEIDEHDKSEKRKAEERAFEAAERAREAEAKAREAAFEADERNKVEDRKAEKQNRLIGHVITGVVGVGGLVFSVWGFKKAMRFEEFGTIASKGGNIMLNRILARK